MPTEAFCSIDKSANSSFLNNDDDDEHEHAHAHAHCYSNSNSITGGNEAFSALSSVHQQQEESFETITAMNNGQLSQVTIVSFGGISTSQHEQKMALVVVASPHYKNIYE